MLLPKTRERYRGIVVQLGGKLYLGFVSWYENSTTMR